MANRPRGLWIIGDAPEPSFRLDCIRDQHHNHLGQLVNDCTLDRPPASSGASRKQILGVLARLHVDYGLGEDAVYDTVSAALVANAPAAEPSFALPEPYLKIAKMHFALPSHQAGVAVAMLLDAADNLVAAVQAGHLESRDAVIQLGDLFLPLFEGSDPTCTPLRSPSEPVESRGCSPR